jgi:diguanylate cyclase (GGDEF)-like protein/PAS domain S-box-containing protein
VPETVDGRKPAEVAPDAPLHRQLFHQIISSAGDGIIVYDRELRYMVWNPTMEVLTGLSAGEVLGRTSAELFPSLQSRVQKLLEGALQGEMQHAPDLPFHVPQTGRSGWVAGTYGPLRDDSGAIIGVIGIIRDITERRRAEKLQSALYRIAQTTSAAEDMDAFYAAIHGIVGELMYARNFYIAIYDKATDLIRFPYFVDEVDVVPPVVVRPGKTLTGYLLRTGQPLLASPKVFEGLVARGEVESVGGSSVDWLGVPLTRGDEAFGVLVVQSYSETVRFTDADRDLLTFVSQHVAAAFDRKRGADALRESESRFRALADTAPCAIFIYQGQSFLYVNAAGADLTGYSLAELQQLAFWDIVHPEFQDLIRERGLARQRGEPVPTRYEFKIRRKDGQPRWVDFSAGTIEFDGQPAALGTAFDVTERKRAEEQITEIAYHDNLTGLPNRLLFHDRLRQAVVQAHRGGHRVAVLFLDLDRFKTINDSLGHTVGDRLLRGVSERISDSVRESDTVARLGGDEFTLLLPRVNDATDVAKVAEKILESLRQAFPVDGHELFVTSSMGISLYPEDGHDPESLVKNADTAMYRAKELGRDKYQLYTPAMNARAMERLALENSLRKALTNDELIIYYQPVVDLETRRIRGLEALLRWRHPELGLVSPAEFIPLAEVTGLILPIGPWLLRTACSQAKAWQEQGMPGLTVSVNLSARQFQQEDLVEQVTHALDVSGLAPACLDLEITESHAMQSPETAAEILRALKAVGVRISIDDFGIGYSSLGYLKRLPIDTLKIDQSFVRDIITDPDDAAIVTAVIAMARTLKLSVVAEGVETEEQLAFLAARGCDRMQGYLFSHPLPPDECGALLRSR